MATPRSQFHEGRFGRLFRHLRACKPDDADLIELADTVIEKAVDVERVDNRRSNIDDPVNGLSSGFTYLGQFIDHDLTFDPVSQLDRINDPDALRDFRTPRFDLDSVYGGGPDQDVFLYDAQDRKHLLPKDQQMIFSATPLALQSSATRAMTRTPSSRTCTSHSSSITTR
jgi:hypothetical protein